MKSSVLLGLFFVQACASSPSSTAPAVANEKIERCYIGDLVDMMPDEPLVIGQLVLWQGHYQGSATLVERKRVSPTAAVQGAESPPLDSKARWVFKEGAFAIESQGVLHEGHLTPASWPWKSWTIVSRSEEGEQIETTVVEANRLTREIRAVDATGRAYLHLMERASVSTDDACASIRP